MLIPYGESWLLVYVGRVWCFSPSVPLYKEDL